jgi:hypothetical protein
MLWCRRLGTCFGGRVFYVLGARGRGRPRPRGLTPFIPFSPAFFLIESLFSSHIVRVLEDSAALLPRYFWTFLLGLGWLWKTCKLGSLVQTLL